MTKHITTLAFVTTLAAFFVFVCLGALDEGHDEAARAWQADQAIQPVER